LVKSTVLNYQSPTTGLFPIKTFAECNEAKVRDNLYCAASSWALALAYRRIDDDKGRTHELEHCAIKCMRGILYCYMRQADKVEQFKQDPSPSKCLHSVFNIHTGDEVLNYDTYCHLQVAFIQNLVFCVERAYRVPDFGMWERGSKYNNGSTELHSSSVGLAKAALEAINGFNLFGNQGCSWSVIFVDIDAHNRNRQTLCSLLPRESRSHNTDAALLPCISYPAFAVDDDALYNQTLDKIVRKLKGKYGFKRFLRDGYRTAREDKNRLFYKPAEIKLFDGIECEFPLFYIFMIIDGVFRGNSEQVKEYQILLEPVLFQSYDGHAVVPKYYYVPADFVEAEQKNHGSQKRFSSNSGRDGKLFLWGQSLYIIAKLLVDGLISPRDIDPVRRYVPLEHQRNVSMRYSNQGPLENDVVIHVALIAESQRLQVFLNTYGIQTQTPQQVEPIQIWPQQELVKGHHVTKKKPKTRSSFKIIGALNIFQAYRHLAANQKLGLSGRPERPVGCIGTSKIYRILGKTVVCYPIVFDLSDFYMSQDVMLLIDDIKNALQFIKQYWKMHGRPLFLVLIREDNLRLPQFKSFEELELPKHSKVKRQTSTPNASDLEQQPEININDWKQTPTFEILQKLDAYRHLAANQKLGLSGRPERPVGCIGTSKIYRILGKTVVCYPIVFDLSDFYMSQDVMLLIDDIKNALQFIKQYWKMHGRPLFLVLIREDNLRLPQFKSFEELELPKHSKVKRQTSTPNASDLEQQPEININDWKQTPTFEILQKLDVTLGVFSHEEEVICNPLSPGVIKDIIYSKCNPYGEREAVVQQELVIHIGWIISNSPELFSGMLKIRVGWIIHAMKHELKIRAGDMPAQDLYQLSPSEIKQLLLDVLQPQHQGRCWLNRRQIDGSLNRTPLGFYDRLWQILERTPNGIMVAGTHLPQVRFAFQNVFWRCCPSSEKSGGY
ncbi:UNVERIFIED_CONTAM: hypothetical protein FKN15_002319, partial [Acipenser sinensis]